MRKRLFVDMDGTLAVWDNSKTLEEVTRPGYFRNLTPIQHTVEAIRYLIKNTDLEIYILSAVFNDNHSVFEKMCWLNEYLPEIQTDHMVFTEYGRDKSEFITDICKDDYLLDDNSKNLFMWKGTGIKHYNGINGTKGTWKGYSVYYAMCPETIAEDLLSCM